MRVEMPMRFQALMVTIARIRLASSRSLKWRLACS
jgi:hypothetical protein